MRKTFTKIYSEILRENESASLLLGDIGVHGFREELLDFPNRVFNIGILEQSMIGVAAGMSTAGVTPTIHTIAPFMVERALEQIKVDLAYQGLPANLVSVGASFDYAALGCTHHCPADVNLISNIPGAEIFIPGHADEFAEMFRKNWNNGRLNYFRLSEQVNQTKFKSELGFAERITHGDQGIIVAVGPILDEVITAIQGLSLELHYVSSFSALRELKIHISSSSKKVILIEPYYSGLLLQKSMGVFCSQGFQILQIGIPTDFIRKYGTYAEQLQYVGLDASSLRERIVRFL
jgi:transketolase